MLCTKQDTGLFRHYQNTREKLIKAPSSVDLNFVAETSRRCGTHVATRLLALILSLRYVARNQTSLNSCDRSQRQNSDFHMSHDRGDLPQPVAAMSRCDLSHRVSQPLSQPQTVITTHAAWLNYNTVNLNIMYFPVSIHKFKMQAVWPCITKSPSFTKR